MPWLTPIAEVYFRKARQLSPTADLKEAGFWFPDGRFKLNENFGLTDTALLFNFNMYEIAARSMGETRIAIPLTGIPGLAASGIPVKHWAANGRE